MDKRTGFIDAFVTEKELRGKGIGSSLVMAKVGDTYFCEICGNKVRVLEAGAGVLVCCGKPMKLVKA